MKKQRKAAALITIAILTAVSLSGCGERVKETEKQTETQKQTETEAVTEVVITTEAPQTERQTEKQTEKITEAVTEAVTEQTADLPADQELAAESEYTESKTMYATDDVNVRNTPSTEGTDSIYSSYDQGQEATVTGETPHWYKVLKDETTGYVHKDGLSETVVEPKSPEERAAAAANAASAGTTAAETAYADGYTITLAQDANLRVSASENGDVISVLSAGSTAVAIGETGDWYQVDYNGTVGYVHKNLVN